MVAGAIFDVSRYPVVTLSKGGGGRGGAGGGAGASPNRNAEGEVMAECVAQHRNKQDETDFIDTRQGLNVGGRKGGGGVMEQGDVSGSGS